MVLTAPNRKEMTFSGSSLRAASTTEKQASVLKVIWLYLFERLSIGLRDQIEIRWIGNATQNCKGCVSKCYVGVSAALNLQTCDARTVSHGTPTIRQMHIESFGLHRRNVQSSKS